MHPYDEVTWERRDVVQTNWKTGETIFEQRGVEFPSTWSMNATTIVTTKYFRGAVGTEQREHSLRQLIDRVVLTYVRAGTQHGYFATEADAEVFEHELTWMLLHQLFSFNSPVWFNVGTPSAQQVSACFILSVDDTMDSILNWYREEGMIFKGGSGAGLNLSRIRSSKELLSSGGTASGPISFMRGADASAGTIKSGGATRRAAKMVVLDVDHPDIEEFVETKAREEDKIRALRDAGFDMDLGGKDIVSVQYQNANNSVRVSDEFMQAVADGTEFGLRARTDGSVVSTVDAKGLFRRIAEAAWACADPGIQYDSTINDWHTSPESGRINASNPCSEYMHLDNSSCNLASLNLLTFLREGDTFDVERFVKAVELVITAMDISICFADFPTQAIGETTRTFRQLGIGYANLGALLMATGHGYDSAGGRALAAAITSLMTGTAYKRSAELAAVVGPYDGYAQNAEGHQRVMRKHAAANDDIRTLHVMDAEIHAAATKAWADGNKLGARDGWRNAQASVLAPTGTIGFMMDCDTTGVEPDFSLVKFKKLVGGGSMQIVNQTIPRALAKLGYATETAEAVVEYIAEHGHVIDAPGLKPEHYEVFDCAMGERAISPMGHVRMMAAVQPFISGAISKTVNMPEETTVEDVEKLYFDAWSMGIKALAIYRDNCKVGQPLSDAKAKKAPAPAPTPEVSGPARAVRKRLPRQRDSKTTSFTVGGADGYITAGSYPGDGLGEVFLKLGKQGSTLAGVMDAFSIAVSVALQYGVPLETYVQKFTNMRFEPAGMTDDPDVRMAQSMIDYIFRRLALDYLPFETRASLGIYTTAERQRQLETGSYEPITPVEEVEAGDGAQDLDVAPPERALPGPGRGALVGRAHGPLPGPRRGRAALPQLRHQDAAVGIVPRVRGLRFHQRLQLTRQRPGLSSEAGPLRASPACRPGYGRRVILRRHTRRTAQVRPWPADQRVRGSCAGRRSVRRAMPGPRHARNRAAHRGPWWTAVPAALPPVRSAVLRPVAVLVATSALVAGSVTQLTIHQVELDATAVAAQAAQEVQREAAAAEAERRRVALAADAERLSGQATAYLAHHRRVARQAALSAVVAADSVTAGSVDLAPPDQVADLDAALAELGHLLDRTPDVDVALTAAANAARSAKSAGVASSGSPTAADPDEPAAPAGEPTVVAEVLPVVPLADAVRLVSSAGHASGDPHTPVDGAAPGATDAPATAMPAGLGDAPARASREAGAAADRSPLTSLTPTTAALSRPPMAGVSATTLLANADLSLRDSQALTELANRVAELSAQVQASIDQALAAQKAAELARAQEAAAAAARAARAADRAAAADAFPNGGIPAAYLCGVDFQRGVQLRCDAAAALEVLNRAYRQDTGRNLQVASSYRTAEQQAALREEKGDLAATAGTSNHGRGLAVDLAGTGSLGQYDAPLYLWLEVHARDAGWHHPSYMEPDGTGPYEPWHWEYATRD